MSKDIIDIYNTSAHWFLENRTRTLLEKKYLEQVVQNIPRYGSVLDLGCGTGRPIAEYFIGKGYEVTGVDAAEEMIELCLGLSGLARWLVRDMRTLNLDQSFDALVAWDSFFHLTPDEQRAMFPLFKKHINPKGVLVFTSGPEAGEVYGEVNGFKIYHSSLSTEEYRALLTENSFSVLEHQVEDVSCGGHTVWVAQRTD